MTPSQRESESRAKAIFLAVADLPPEARAAEGAVLVGGDTWLQQRVACLLRADSKAEQQPLDPDCHATLGADEPDQHAPGPTSEPSSAGTPREPPLHIPGFGVESLIGAGGAGLVYRARQHAPQRDVAIKVLRPGPTTADLLRRFHAEANLLAKLRHPGIAQVLSVGTVPAPDHRPYLVLELVDGRSIIEHARSAAQPERVDLLAQLADAVQRAHTQGVLHRDLKSSNVLVDEHCAVRVLDFGIASLLGRTGAASASPQHARRGTVGSMSPESLGLIDHPVDTRSDIYSIGVIAFEVLTGAHPFASVNATDADDEPGPVRTLDRLTERIRAGLCTPHALDALSKDLRAVVQRAMHPQPASRYQSASELAADLRRARAGLPVQARPIAPPEAVVRAARRRPFFSFAAALVVTLAALGVARIAAERSRAEHHLTTAISTTDVLLNQTLDHLGPLTGTSVERQAIVTQLDRTLPALAAARPEDPRLSLGDVRLAMAKADLALEAGDASTALQLRRDALDRLQRLTTSSRHMPAIDLARLHSLLTVQIGDAHGALGDNAARVEHYLLAERLDDARAQANPQDIGARDDLLWSRQRLARYFLDLDRPRSEHYFDLQHQDALALLALSPNRPGTLFARLQTASDASVYPGARGRSSHLPFSQRVALARRLTERSPDNRDHRSMTLGTLLEAAIDHADRGEHQEAQALLSEAAAHQRILESIAPNDFTIARRAAHIHGVRADVAARGRDYPAACLLQQRAVDALDPADRPPTDAAEVALLRVIALAKLAQYQALDGQHDEARRSLEAAARLSARTLPQPPHPRLHLLELVDMYLRAQAALGDAQTHAQAIAPLLDALHASRPINPAPPAALPTSVAPASQIDALSTAIAALATDLWPTSRSAPGARDADASALTALTALTEAEHQLEADFPELAALLRTRRLACETPPEAE